MPRGLSGIMRRALARLPLGVVVVGLGLGAWALGGTSSLGGYAAPGWSEPERVPVPALSDIHVRSLDVKIGDSVRAGDSLAHTGAPGEAGSVLRAPIDGIVTELRVSSGAALARGHRFAVLLASNSRRLVSYIPETWAPGVAAGDEVRVRRRLGMLTGRHAGRVVEAAPEIVEMPARAAPAGTLTSHWGRRVVIDSEITSQLLPGESVIVEF